MRRLIILFASLVCLGLACHAYAEIYKWVDEDGKVVFSERKPSSDDTVVEQVTPKFDNPRSTVETAPNQASDTPEAPGEAQDIAEKRELTTLSEEQKAKNAAIEKRNCEAAKKRFESLQRPRVNEVLPDGGRRRMGEEERQDALSKTQDTINQWCK